MIKKVRFFQPIGAKQGVRICLVFVIAGLSMGTVVKKQDAIRDTQTNPVAYSEKLKEEAEGKKGPPVPTLELFPKHRFLVEGPVEKEKRKRALKEELVFEPLLDKETTQEEEGAEEFVDWDGEEFKLEDETDDTGEGQGGLP